MTKGLEFEMCCGTVCDKPIAMEQVKRLRTLFDLLHDVPAEVERWLLDVSDLDEACKVVAGSDSNPTVLGVFIPQRFIDALKEDQIRAALQKSPT